MDPELPPEVSELLASDPERFSTLGDLEAKFLLYGGDPAGAPFESETAAVAMWFVHRRLLMASYLGTGRRPMAWHVIEHPTLAWRGPGRERSILFEANLLEPAERDALVAEWRRAFDQAEGLEQDAQAKALASADVPKSLQRMWRRDLRRPQKAGRRPAAGVAVSKSTPEGAEVAAALK